MGKVVDTATLVFDFDNMALKQLYCLQGNQLLQLHSYIFSDTNTIKDSVGDGVVLVNNLK